MTDKDAMIEAVARAFASRYWGENPSYDTLPKAAQATLERAIAHALEAAEPFIKAREQAARPEEQREVLERLFLAMHPKPSREDEPDWQGPGTLREPLYHHWYMKRHRFAAMLDCGAFLSAAEMLVPEGWRIGDLSFDWAKASYSAQIYQEPTEALKQAFNRGDTIMIRTQSAEACEAALALASAIAAAGEG